MRGLPSQVKDDRKSRSLNAQGLGPCPVGVRGFKSHPPHFSMNPPPLQGSFTFLEDQKGLRRCTDILKPCFRKLTSILSILGNL